LYRQRRPMPPYVLWRSLRGKGGIAGYRGTRRRVHWGQLALALPAWREAIALTDRRAIAAFWGCNVFESYCALKVFAGKHGRVLPLHKHADIRGHGRERGRRRWLRVRWQLIGRVGSATWLRPGINREKGLAGWSENCANRANGANTGRWLFVNVQGAPSCTSPALSLIRPARG